MESSQDLKPLRDAVQSALVTVTRSVNSLANEDLQFQRTVHPSVAMRLDKNTDHMFKLASGVLKSAAGLTAQREVRLDDADDVEIQWKGVVDVIDSLLEKADTCLDEYTGLIKRKDAPTAEAGRDLKRPKSTTERLDWSLKRANILKPQNAFERKIDNLDSGPWKPLLTGKPHAQVPLEKSLTTFTDEEDRTQYRHPYEQEITTMVYPKEVSGPCEPQKYLPIEKTKAIWVDTYEGVLEMLDELKQAKEIALDLEHHDFRSYTGLLSLMQISTREKDWIVDTLVPWRHKLEVLNEVFADPSIVKVLHGAFMDVIWLQRDLGLYVVGLFDTFYACEGLGYSGRSLAFLLKKFADFDADKKYQQADWRIRPLPKEMFYYAQSDTHYLLYIYDMLRNELAALKNSPDGDPMDRIIKKSKEVALQRYENPFLDSETGAGNKGWFNTLIKSPALYNGEQFAVYKAVHKWRDDLARAEDESTGSLMTQQVLSDIARILPTDPKALWSVLGASARTLKPHISKLFKVIKEARERGANGPTMMEFFRQHSTGTAGQPAVAPTKPAATPLEIQQLKSDRSQLWGTVALSSARDGSAKAPASDDQVHIPLFSFDFGAVEDNLPVPEPIPNPASQKAAESAIPQEEEGFTLKKTGRKRKASDAASENGSASPEDVEMADSTPPSDQADDTTTNDRDAKRLHRKAAKAAARAEKKQQQQQQQQQQQSQASQPDQQPQPASASPSSASPSSNEDQPFDYTQASSILHASKSANAANKDGKGGKKGKGKGKPAFDPYAQNRATRRRGAEVEL
ncbi:exosome nuclease subunit [Collariella sp. IMI 366227]|nr:exosome nuclease subunit [Collariella sp. IMI 366227]